MVSQQMGGEVPVRWSVPRENLMPSKGHVAWHGGRDRLRAF